MTIDLAVCIPNYNMGTWVASAIRSALMQPVAEIVIADNASTDESLAVLEDFQDKRLSIFRHEDHLTVYESINRAISHSTAQWCVVLCADDELTASFASQFASGLRRHPDAVAISQFALDPTGPAIVGDSKEVIYTTSIQVFNSPTFPLSSTVFRRSAFEKVGGFDPSAGWPADWDFWIRLVMKAGPLVALGMPGALYHRSRGAWATAAMTPNEIERFKVWHDYRREQWPPILVAAIERSLIERTEGVGRRLLAEGDPTGLAFLRAAADAGSRSAVRRLRLEKHVVLARAYDAMRGVMRRAVRRLEVAVR